MLYDKPIPLLDLIISICDATELINPKINQHGKRVAYTALNFADALGMSQPEKRDIVIACLLHDIGAFSLKEKLEAMKFEFEIRNNRKQVNRHGLLGYKLLENFKPFLKIARIIKCHHYNLEELKYEDIDEEIAFASQIVHISDRIDILIDNKKEVLGQVEKVVDTIKEYQEDYFEKKIIDIFKALAKREYFWFDAISNPRISTFSKKLGFISLDFGLGKITEFAKMFSYIIDFRSSFTATHSSGVTAAASSIAKYMGLSPRECKMMEVAGYLHDLGKLSIPSEILDKPSALTDEEFEVIKGHTYYTYQILDKITNLGIINEWASLHHEKLDGSGYPFHLNSDQLSIGSRIMAVADNFTAITEDRPYRRGMEKKEVIGFLDNMAGDSKLDPRIIMIIKNHFNDINHERLKAQDKAFQEFKELGTFHI